MYLFALATQPFPLVICQVRTSLFTHYSLQYSLQNRGDVWILFKGVLSISNCGNINDRSSRIDPIRREGGRVAQNPTIARDLNFLFNLFLGILCALPTGLFYESQRKFWWELSFDVSLSFFLLIFYIFFSKNHHSSCCS